MAAGGRLLCEVEQDGSGYDEQVIRITPLEPRSILRTTVIAFLPKVCCKGHNVQSQMPGKND